MATVIWSNSLYIYSAKSRPVDVYELKRTMFDFWKKPKLYGKRVSGMYNLLWKYIWVFDTVPILVLIFMHVIPRWSSDMNHYVIRVHMLCVTHVYQDHIYGAMILLPNTFFVFIPLVPVCVYLLNANLPVIFMTRLYPTCLWILWQSSVPLHQSGPHYFGFGIYKIVLPCVSCAGLWLWVRWLCQVFSLCVCSLMRCKKCLQL